MATTTNLDTNALFLYVMDVRLDPRYLVTYPEGRIKEEEVPSEGGGGGSTQPLRIIQSGSIQGISGPYKGVQGYLPLLTITNGSCPPHLLLGNGLLLVMPSAGVEAG